MLRLLADANIPHAAAAFGALGEVRTAPGREITREQLASVDALLVRSVTTVDAALVGGTPVRFVGTATAGVDHIDPEALAARGIAFASAPGSNAASVVDYVLAALLAVAADRGERLDGRTLGVVGAGEVGGLLVPRARALGLSVVVSDPPRAARGRDDHAYLPLADLLRQSDIVTLHTPLADGGRWPTRGLIGMREAEQMGAAWLVNAARGPIVTAEAALHLAQTRPTVLDVWPGEPTPAPALVEAAAIATPHIAGYALDAKVRGTAMIADALRQWHRAATGEALAPWDAPLDAPAALQAPDGPTATPADRVRWLDALARQSVDIRGDDARFRAQMAAATDADRGARFAALRRDYPVRRELSRGAVVGAVPALLADAVGAGLRLRQDEQTAP